MLLRFGLTIVPHGSWNDDEDDITSGHRIGNVARRGEGTTLHHRPHPIIEIEVGERTFPSIDGCHGVRIDICADQCEALFRKVNGSGESHIPEPDNTDSGLG